MRADRDDANPATVRASLLANHVASQWGEQENRESAG